MRHITLIDGSGTRQRRKAKANADLQTQHKLWTARIQDIMAAEGCDAKMALKKLEGEVAKEILIRPQWKQTMWLAWASYIRRIKQ